tara:strand:+ start:845 stop:1780 length:936 start_codon:yes stop_codon:yes gene_type:complete
MSILNVNKINPVGGGSTVTIAGIASVTNNISVGNSVTANSFHGDGSQLTGISVDSTKIETGNTKVETIDTGSDGHIKFTTEGGERIRIQSDGDVGIGTINNTNNERLRVQDDASTSTVCQVSIISGSAERSILNFGDKEDPNIGRVSYHNNTNTISLFTNNTERLLINSDGHVTKPANPSFRATASSSLDYTSDNTLAFQNEKHDVGGYYNNSNSYYTIPTTGYYKFEVMHFAQPGQIARVQLERSTDSGSSWSIIQIGPRIESSGGGRYIAGWMHVFHEFTATNLVRVRWSQGNVHINNGYGWFQGWLVQ